MFKSFIIADYFIDKSLIFARKTLQNDEFLLYSRLFGIINSALPKPDLILYLYNNVKQLKENILTRGRDYEKEIEYSYLEKIQSGYLDYFKTLKGLRIVIVETVNLDFVHNRSDYFRLRELLNKNYDEGIHTITF
jgi:deoxyadenosine/deoxycytidine kinase